MDKLVLIHKGRDNWGMPVYECDGKLYVDVDPRKNSKPDICTKQSNSFYGEPLESIGLNIEVEFVPRRDTWNF